MKRTAIYAGTFDPFTMGHLDLVERASQVFDRLILAVAGSTRKTTLFDLQQRVQIASEVVVGFANVEVDSFDGLLVDYARLQDVHVLVRGLRAFSDFEYEFQMALMNRRLGPHIETLFMMPKEEHSCVSSSAVREIAELGGDISSFVPTLVEEALKKKFDAI